VILDAFGQLLRASWRLDVEPAIVEGVRSTQQKLVGKSTEDRDGAAGKKGYHAVDKAGRRTPTAGRVQQSGTDDITDDDEDEDGDDDGPAVGDRRHRINAPSDKRAGQHASVPNLRDRGEAPTDSSAGTGTGIAADADQNPTLRLLTRQGRSADAPVLGLSPPGPLAGGDHASVAAAGVGLASPASLGRSAGESIAGGSLLPGSADAGSAGARGKAGRLLYAASVLSIKGKQASSRGQIVVPVAQPASSAAPPLTPHTAAAALFASQFAAGSDASDAGESAGGNGHGQLLQSSPNAGPHANEQAQPPSENARPVQLVDRVHRVVGEHRRRQSAIQGTFRSDRPVMASVVSAVMAAAAEMPAKQPSQVSARFVEEEEEEQQQQHAEPQSTPPAAD
jgi:hypothetical protein